MRTSVIRIIYTAAVTALMLACVAPSGRCAQKQRDVNEQDDSVRSLAGVKGITLDVWALPESIRAAGLTESRLRAEIEARLFEAGIRVLTAEEGAKAAAPALAVEADANTNKAGLHGVSFRLYLRQPVLLKRDRRIEVRAATTWSDGMFGTAGKDADLAEAVRNIVVTQQIGRFIDDYNKANPKREGAGPGHEGKANDKPIGDSK